MRATARTSWRLAGVLHLDLLLGLGLGLLGHRDGLRLALQGLDLVLQAAHLALEEVAVLLQALLRLEVARVELEHLGHRLVELGHEGLAAREVELGDEPDRGGVLLVRLPLQRLQLPLQRLHRRLDDDCGELGQELLADGALLLLLLLADALGAGAERRVGRRVRGEDANHSAERTDLCVTRSSVRSDGAL